MLSAYAVFLGPMVGLLCTHFYMIQKRRFHAPDLFEGVKESIYWYNCGVNWRTVVAWIVAVFPRLVPPLFSMLGCLDFEAYRDR